MSQLVKERKRKVPLKHGRCKERVYIGIEQILPFMVSWYVIVQFLQLTGFS